MGAPTHEPGGVPTAAGASESCSTAQEGTPAPEARRLQPDPSCDKFADKLRYFENIKLKQSTSAAESAPSAEQSASPAPTPASSATATQQKPLETYDDILPEDLEASAELSLHIKGILDKNSLHVSLQQDWEDHCARRQSQLLQRIKEHDDEYSVENLLKACVGVFDRDLILKEAEFNDENVQCAISTAKYNSSAGVAEAGIWATTSLIVRHRASLAISGAAHQP